MGPPECRADGSIVVIATRERHAQTVTVGVTVSRDGVSQFQVVDRELPDLCLLPSALLLSVVLSADMSQCGRKP